MRSTHSDPTANAAIARVDRELRLRARREEPRTRAQRPAPEKTPEPAPARRSHAGWVLVWTDRRGRIR